MRAVRSFLCWVLAIEAVICWWDVLQGLLRTLDLLETQGPSSGSHELMSTLPLMAGGSLLTLFCLAYWRRWQSARLWAVVVGGFHFAVAGLFLLEAWIFPQNQVIRGLWLLEIVLLLVGALTTAAFWRWDPEAEKLQAVSPAGIAGDGTHPWLDKLPWIIGFTGFLGAMQGWGHWARLVGLHPNAGLGFGPEVLIAGLLTVLVHEMGHALTGIALGMRLRAFVVGPLHWRIRDGRWTFKFRLADLLATGGSTAVVPTTPHQSREREIWMIAGGPAASWLSGMLALAALLTAPGHPWAAAWQFLSLFTTFSLAAAVVNLLPFHTRKSYSDGAQIYQLLSGGPWGDYHLALSIVGASTVTPLRPRDFDTEAMERAALVLQRGPRAVHLRLLEFCSCLDRGQLREASQALNAAEAMAIDALAEIPAEFCSDFVFGKAFVQRDAEGARNWWARLEAKQLARRNADYWLARAAALWMEGKTAEAKEAWDRGNALASRLPRAGAYDADRDKFSMLLRELTIERRIPRWHDDIALTTGGG